MKYALGRLHVALDSRRRPRVGGGACARACGRRVDRAIVQEYLIGMAEQGRGGEGRGGPRMSVTTVISGPPGFNEHCESLIRRLVPRAEPHAVLVLDA